MADIFFELRIVLRQLVKQRVFAAGAIITLSVGIGASVAVFGAVDALVLRSLPLPDSHRLVEVYGSNKERDLSYLGLSVPNFLDLRSDSRSMRMAAFESAAYTVGGGDSPERVGGHSVSWDFFQVLGIRPALGRGFRPEEERVGQNQVVVISDGFWRRRFGSKLDVLGEALILDGMSYTVVGILPPTFWFRGQERDVWTPLVPSEEADRRSDALHVVARLEPGTTLDQAQAEVSGITRRLVTAFPEANDGWEARVRSFHSHVVATELRLGSLICLVATTILLLVVCANVANLNLSRLSGRRREMAIRAALGATRARLARYVLLEALVVSLLAGGLGVLFSMWGSDGIVALLPSWIPTLGEVGVDGKVLAFAVTVSVLAAVFVGMVPALLSPRWSLRSHLWQPWAKGVDLAGRRIAMGLIVAQVSLAIGLIVASTLLIQSFMNLRTADFGWDTGGVMTFAVDLPDQEYPDDEARERFFARLLQDLEALPGVTSAGGTSLLPTGGDFHLSYEVFASQGHVPETQQFARGRFVLPGYFRTMGIPVLGGRELETKDGGQGDPVVVVNEAFSLRHWADGDAIGNAVVVDGTRYQVVGVVSNTMDWDRRIEPTLYLSALQAGRPYLNLVVRVQNRAGRLNEIVGPTVAAIDPRLPVLRPQTMDEVSRRERVGELALAKLVPVLGGVALLLAMVGVYGLTANAVSSRTREIGIRMAVGARRVDVLSRVAQQSLRPTVIGVVIGMGLALALARGLSAFLFGVSPFHLPVFSGVALAVLGTSLLAAYLPARRAAGLDPVMALREE